MHYITEFSIGLHRVLCVNLLYAVQLYLFASIFMSTKFYSVLAVSYIENSYFHLYYDLVLRWWPTRMEVHRCISYNLCIDLKTRRVLKTLIDDSKENKSSYVILTDKLMCRHPFEFLKFFFILDKIMSITLCNELTHASNCTDVIRNNHVCSRTFLQQVFLESVH